jgi:C-terminal processing protease CtpA/Prc
LDSLKPDEIKLKETESGIGPSDHTSFYLQNIPVLHFFSGSHADYHKPSDDEDKINYEGQVAIVRMIENILTRLDQSDKLVFLQTKSDSSEEVPRFKVTLGVVPDYTFEGEGMRIDGVTDGKPASRAGLQPGDIVIQLGENKVVDMMSYMKALGKFKHGDKSIVKIRRGKEVLDKEIVF